MTDKADGKPSAPPGPSPWTLMLMVLLTLYICKRPADPKLGLDGCGKNLHTIGVALEKFRLSADDRLYPQKLEEVYKDGAISVCPVGGKGTYYAGYQPSADRRSYLLVCKGEHHKTAGVPSDYPRIGYGPHETGTSGEKSTSAPSPSPAGSPTPQATPESQGPPTPPIPASATPNP